MSWFFSIFALGCVSTDLDSADLPLGISVTLTDFQYRACWDDVSGSESVTTSQVGVGAIAVEHEIQFGDCIIPSALAYADEDWIRVEYEQAKEGSCSSECWFRVQFMLTGVPAGTWTVAIEDAPTSSVVVP